MKIFILYAVAILILLAAYPVKSTENKGDKNKEPSCCNQYKCSEKEMPAEPDDLIPFQLSPFHI